MHHFCTYFDEYYALRGLTLYQSLKTNLTDFTLWILCLDSQTFKKLNSLKLENIKLIPLESLEQTYSELKTAKGNRTQVEYYFTLTPCLPFYILETNPNIKQLTYIDADIYFFTSPEPIFKEFEPYSILIIEHRFPKHLKNEANSYGTYNVGFLSFKNNPQGKTCLTQWKNQCINWCYDRVENGKFADQKYLDTWPDDYSEVLVLKNKGANAAPWNINGTQMKTSNGKYFIDDHELIFFHFHGIKAINGTVLNLSFRNYHLKPNTIIKKLYTYYISELFHVYKNQKKLFPYFLKTKRGTTRSTPTLTKRIRSTLSIIKNILQGHYIIHLFNKPIFIFILKDKKHN